MSRLRISILPILVVLSLLLPQTPTLAQTATPTATPDARTLTEVGAIQIYAGTAGDGWLLCDGSTVSRETYARLFAVIGTTFGTGDGSTTFKLPDLRGRVAVGTGLASGLTLRSLGQIFGEEYHHQTLDELAAHEHTITDPGHQHNQQINGVAAVSSGTGAGFRYGSVASNPSSPRTVTDVSTTGITVDSAGGGGAFPVIQPSLGLNFYIWSGVNELDIITDSDIVITVVVVFPTHTPTPTPTPTLTPTTGPSPTPTATATPTGVSPYESVTTINGQPVVFEYRIGPGDAAVFGTTFLIVGLIIYALWMQIKRRRG